MALLTGYSDTNKELRQSAATRTVRTLASAYGVWYWHVESITTESFSYVGMTKAAADACAAAMVTAYMKTKSIPSIQAGEIVTTSVSQCVADIRAVRTEGNTWQVNVEVNEVDHSFLLAAAEQEDP